MFEDVINVPEETGDYERELKWYQDKFTEVRELLKECKQEIIDTRAERDEFHEDAKRAVKFLKDSLDTIKEYRKDVGQKTYDKIDVDVIEKDEGISVVVTSVTEDSD